MDNKVLTQDHIQNGRSISIRLMEDEENPEDAMVDAAKWIDQTLGPGPEIVVDPEDRLKYLQMVCNVLRSKLKLIEAKTRDLMKSELFMSKQKYEGQHAEMDAQIMLTVRHLEDARMRFGKILQYAGDGVSILDKK